MIRSIHGILVVFHHDERIADVSQPAKCLQQFFIVLLVQSDTGFVQNVKNAHQPRADLSRKADPLRFSSGQGRRRSGQGQIIQSHVGQKCQSAAYLLDDFSSDLPMRLRQIKMLYKSNGLRYGHITEFHDIFTANRHCQKLWLQFVAFAGRASGDTHIFLHFFLDPL